MKTLMTHLFALALSLAWVSIAQGDPSSKAKPDSHLFPERRLSVAESLPIRNQKPVETPMGPSSDEIVWETDYDSDDYDSDAEETSREILVVEQSPPAYERAEPRWTPIVLEQSPPVYERVCSLESEDAALIVQVLTECGNVRDTGTVRNNPLLECWDNGRLTLTAEEVVKFQRLANTASACELLSTDDCWKNYCSNRGYL